MELNTEKKRSVGPSVSCFYLLFALILPDVTHSRLLSLRYYHIRLTCTLPRPLQTGHKSPHIKPSWMRRSILPCVHQRRILFFSQRDLLYIIVHRARKTSHEQRQQSNGTTFLRSLFCADIFQVLVDGGSLIGRQAMTDSAK